MIGEELFASGWQEDALDAEVPLRATLDDLNSGHGCLLNKGIKPRSRQLRAHPASDLASPSPPPALPTREQGSLRDSPPPALSLPPVSPG